MANIIEKAYVSVFPHGKIAWDGMGNGTERELSDGIAVQAERDRQAGKDIVNNFFPDSTELQKEWEEVFKLPSGEVLTKEQRLKRLIASFSKSPSTASFDGQNNIYNLSGLEVIARPLKPGEDPRVLAEKTDAHILADGRPGLTELNYITVCGSARCGSTSSSSRCGNFEGTRELGLNLSIPNDEWTWPLIYVIEGEWGGFASVPPELKDAFYFLTYKSKPIFMWAIANVYFGDITNYIKTTPDGKIKTTPDGKIKYMQKKE